MSVSFVLRLSVAIRFASGLGAVPSASGRELSLAVNLAKSNGTSKALENPLAKRIISDSVAGTVIRRCWLSWSVVNFRTPIPCSARPLHAASASSNRARMKLPWDSIESPPHSLIMRVTLVRNCLIRATFASISGR